MINKSEDDSIINNPIISEDMFNSDDVQANPINISELTLDMNTQLSVCDNNTSTVISIDQRDNDIRHLVNSRLLKSWEDEYLRIIEEYNNVDAIKKLFPRFYMGMNIFNSKYAFYIACVFQVWNIIGFFLPMQGMCLSMWFGNAFNLVLLALQCWLPAAVLCIQYIIIK